MVTVWRENGAWQCKAVDEQGVVAEATFSCEVRNFRWALQATIDDLVLPIAMNGFSRRYDENRVLVGEWMDPSFR